MTLSFDENRIGSKVQSRMLVEKILASTCSGLGEVCVLNDWCFATVFSMSGASTSFLAVFFELQVSVFGVKTLGLTFDGFT
jgi:hypothetical protein